MADENIWEPNPRPEKVEPDNTNNTNGKPKVNFTLVGINILVLAGYTLLVKFMGEGGFIIDAIFLFLHVLACIIMALSARSWMWLLSGVLVLAIGFSTCVLLANSSGFK